MRRPLPLLATDEKRGTEWIVHCRRRRNDAPQLNPMCSDKAWRTTISLDIGCFTRAGFEPLARHIVLAAGPGDCSSDHDLLPFKNPRRPIYPSDANIGPDA